jgi:hypothetical protein
MPEPVGEGDFGSYGLGWLQPVYWAVPPKNPISNDRPNNLNRFRLVVQKKQPAAPIRHIWRSGLLVFNQSFSVN